MKVLFINPFGKVKLINIALGILSGFLQQHGHMVKTIDFNNYQERDGFSVVKRAALKWEPDLIGISVHSTTYENSCQLAGYLRKITTTPIVVGGPQVTFKGADILKDCSGFDYAIIGEGEWTILELLDHFNGGQDIKHIRGLAYRGRNGKVEQNPAKDLIQNLDSLPYPDYSSFGISKINDYWLLSSRGCPYECNFCLRVAGKTWRAASPSYIIGEIKNAKAKYSIERFSFVDSTFNLKISRVEDFCKKLIEERIDLPWQCLGVRANIIRESMVKALKKAGCERVGIGIETLDPKVFNEVKKGETLEEIIDGIKLFQNHGIQVHGYFVIGLPYDTYQKTMSSFKNSRSLKLDSEVWQLLVPYPGTRAYRWYKEYGTIHKDYTEADTMDFSGRLNENIVACDTPEFTRAERIKAYNLISWKTRGYPVPQGVSRISLVPHIMKNLWRYDRENLSSHIKYFIGRGLELLLRGKLLQKTGTGIEFFDDHF